LSNNQRGVLATCGCMTAFTVNDVLVKQLLLTYPAGEVIFVRGIITSLLIGIVALASGMDRNCAAASPGPWPRARCLTPCPPRASSLRWRT